MKVTIKDVAKEANVVETATLASFATSFIVTFIPHLPLYNIF